MSTRSRWRALCLLGLVALCACQSTPSPVAAAAGDPPPFRVALLLLDGVYDTELTAPLDVLHHARSRADRRVEVFTVGRNLDVVTSYEGLRLLPDHSLDDAPWPDILVVPSGEHSMGRDAEDAAVLRWLRAATARARWSLSVCDGAFLLAAGGALDGRACTTYLDDAEALQQRHPSLEVRRGPLFVVDGTVITGQGGARSFEPALWLVEHCFGADCARAVAHGMVLDWPLDPDCYEIRPPNLGR